MAFFLSNRDGGLTDEQGHYRFQTNVWDGNVIGGGLQVTQNSPLGMSVLVGAGDAKVPYGGYAYTAWNDAAVAVTIQTANPSNPRIDRLVLYIDRAETPQQVNPNNPGIPKLMVVAGTPGAVPARPNSTAVNSAVGATNPWIDLADVRVNAGVTQITNANITRTATPVTVSGVMPSASGYISTAQSTTMTAWTNLGTVGPVATINVGSSGVVLVTMHALSSTANNSYSSDLSFIMSGANTLSTPSSEYVCRSNSVQGRESEISGTFVVSGLNPGVTTFTVRYRTMSGSGGSTYSQRKIGVVTL